MPADDEAPESSSTAGPVSLLVTKPDGSEFSIESLTTSSSVQLAKQAIEAEQGDAWLSFELWVVGSSDQLADSTLLSACISAGEGTAGEGGDEDGQLAPSIKLLMISGGEEMVARKSMEHDWGFSPNHLSLLEEFYAAHPECPATKWLKPAERTWESDRAFWANKIKKKEETLAVQDHLMWTNTFSATCTDASEPRYLKAKPGEKIKCAINYTHKETKTTCIIQFQIAIDFEHPVANISQICNSANINKAKNFSLTAPSKPGLYMIWSKCCYHYSFRQAEDSYPTSYKDCESWYANFIAWVRVDEAAAERPPAAKRAAAW